MDWLMKLCRRKIEAGIKGHASDPDVISMSSMKSNVPLGESKTIETFSDFLVGRIQERAKRKNMYVIEKTPRATAAWNGVRWEDTYELARTLYMFGDCIYFAAAIAKRLKIPHLHLIPIKIGNTIQDISSIDPIHSVAKYRDDVYLDFDGAHNLSQLKHKYCTGDVREIELKSEADLRIIYGCDHEQKQLATDVLDELITKEKWKYLG